CRLQLAGTKRHGGGAGDNGRGDQQHERRADLHCGQEGLFPRRRPGRQSDQFSLGGGHGGAARGRPDRSRRRLRLGWALQCGCARHQDQDRSGQGVVPAGLRRHQNSRSQGPCRERALQVAQDLKGMKFAMNAPGVSNTSTLNTLLQSAGLKYSDVETVDLPLPDHVAALKNKSVDASASVEPGPAFAIRNGDAVLIKSDDEILPNHQIAVLLYSEEFASKRTDAARRFMRAYIRAVRFYNGALKTGRLDGANADDVIAILSEATPIKSRDIYKL